MRPYVAILAGLGVILVAVGAWGWTRSRRAPAASGDVLKPGGLQGHAVGAVLVLGDSLTGTSGYCPTIRAALPSGSSLICRSYSGKGAGEIAKHLAETGGRFTDLVVLAGVNDLATYGPRHGVDRAQAGLDVIYAAAQARGMRVVALTITPWADHPTGALMRPQTDALNTWIRHHPDVDVVVETAAMGDASGRLLPEYAGRGDGLHLTPIGGKALAELVLRQAFDVA